jgi:hypothetical protein
MLATRRRIAGTTALAALIASATLGLVAATPAQAAGERPVAYVAADTGKETENPGVAAGSGCDNPVQSDTMALGDESTGMGNVHVDACLFDGSERVDVQAAFDVSGVGVIAGCPDADMESPKTATKTDDRCLQGGFEEANSEYHVRVVSATAGVQTVRFCADPEGNGCDDAEDVSTVRITWGAPQGGVAAGGGSPASSQQGVLVGLALAAAAAAAGAGVVAGRR